ARAIPYTLFADGRAGAASFGVELRSTGGAAAVFHVRSADPAQAPRTYTVGSGRQVGDSWDAASGYDLSVFGPNGFCRRCKGGPGPQSAILDIRAQYDERRTEIVLELANRGPRPVDLSVADRYAGRSSRVSLNRGESTSERFALSRTRGWYDLTVTVQ